MSVVRSMRTATTVPLDSQKPGEELPGTGRRLPLRACVTRTPGGSRKPGRREEAAIGPIERQPFKAWVARPPRGSRRPRGRAHRTRERPPSKDSHSRPGLHAHREALGSCAAERTGPESGLHRKTATQGLGCTHTGRLSEASSGRVQARRERPPSKDSLPRPGLHAHREALGSRGRPRRAERLPR